MCVCVIMENYSSLRKKEYLLFVTTRMDLEEIMQSEDRETNTISEIRQRDKSKASLEKKSHLYVESKKNHTCRDRE